MAVISKKDEGVLLLLYNRSGYVLDFSRIILLTYLQQQVWESL